MTVRTGMWRRFVSERIAGHFGRPTAKFQLGRCINITNQGYKWPPNQ